MAGIILVRSSLVEDKSVGIAREKFKKKSYELKEDKYVLGEHTLYYYHDLFGEVSKTYKNADGDCFFVVGTLIVDGKTGIDALQIIEDRLDRRQNIEDMFFSGSYILIIYRKGQ